MEELNTITSAIALSMGVAWASGINLYAAILTLGILSATGSMELPNQLLIVENPVVLTVAGFMFIVEFFADKTPGVDSGWDAIQTFVRIPAGAVLAACAVGDVSAPIALSAALLGGGVAATTHATKAGTRVLINTSPEPVSNWVTSITEDVAVVVGLWTALHYPVLFIAILVFLILAMIWALPKIWRGVKLLFTKIYSLFRKEAKDVGNELKTTEDSENSVVPEEKTTEDTEVSTP